MTTLQICVLHYLGKNEGFVDTISAHLRVMRFEVSPTAFSHLMKRMTRSGLVEALWVGKGFGKTRRWRIQPKGRKALQEFIEFSAVIAGQMERLSRSGPALSGQLRQGEPVQRIVERRIALCDD